MEPAAQPNDIGQTVIPNQQNHAGHRPETGEDHSRVPDERSGLGVECQATSDSVRSDPGQARSTNSVFWLGRYAFRLGPSYVMVISLRRSTRRRRFREHWFFDNRLAASMSTHWGAIVPGQKED